MRPEDMPSPTQRPSMGDILPRTRYTRPSEGLEAAMSAELPPISPAGKARPMDVIPRPATAHPDPSHMLEPPHQSAIEAHSDVPLGPSLPTVDIDDKPEKPRRKKKWLVWLIIFIILILLAIGGALGGKWWYDEQFKPVSGASDTTVRVTIESGMTPDQIGKLLQEKGVIRSELVFSFYTKEQNVQNKLQAGSYSLKPSESLVEIINHLVQGKTDEFSITFLPGDTLANNRERFIKAGYTASEVDAALAKQYDHPLFATKPASADLEGYIYGETYSFTSDATPEQILERTFDEFNKQIVAYDLVNAYKKQGLTLFEGITLASIIQREVSGEADEKQVAQVFLKRLKDGMPLGSDVTYIYAAKKMGVTATPDLKSPYNTRIHKGLTPGPIAVPGVSALRAVAAPAAGDFNYFLAGDDGKTYFAKTYAEHEANITNHCQKGCQ